MALGSGTAAAQVRTGGARVGSAAVGTAVASLKPVGATTGWGRVAVQDRWAFGELRRTIEIELVGLAPRATFAVAVDGVDLGRFSTDGSGDGTWSLRVEGAGSTSGGLVPRAEWLHDASVLDQSGAFVLDGRFSTRARDSGAATVHEERIALAGPGPASGIATVESHADGMQEFATRATGLRAGESYRIIVDGFLAGTRTADEVGQAKLGLESPDDSDPLPTELQPVESLRVVEWLDAGGSRVLSGAFTGASSSGDDLPGDDDGGTEAQFEGEVGRVEASGFELETSSGSLTVRVRSATRWEDGLTGLGDVAAGMSVEVEGTLEQDGSLDARKVKPED